MIKKHCIHLLFFFLSLCFTSQAIAITGHIQATNITVNRLDEPIWVKLQLDPAQVKKVGHYFINQILLSVNWQHPAKLNIALCDAQRSRCQTAEPNGRLFGAFFTDQTLGQPLWLKVIAAAWQGGYPPAHARAELVLWAKP